MNVEIEVPGLRIKLEFTDKKHIDRTVLAVMEYAKGGSFKNVYDVAQTYTTRDYSEKKSTFIPEINGVKTYEDGTKGYKCRYECGCGNNGTRYIKEDEVYCKCHKCKSHLTVQASTPDELHNEDYDYFLAY